MKYVIIIIESVMAICAIIFGIINYFYWQKTAERKIKDYKERQQFEERKNFLKKLEQENASAISQLTTLNAEIAQKSQFNNSLFELREEELQRIMDIKRQSAEDALSEEITAWGKSAQEAEAFAAKQAHLLTQKEIDNEQLILRDLKQEIEEYRARRDTINQEILRSRAIEENRDFYKIQIPYEATQDITVLNSIKHQLKFAFLDKMIYDNYISRPTKEMIKRILAGRNPSGIYKVTNLLTNEIYIGKSVTIADRWQNHIKAACGLDGVAESQFQRALRQYGIDNFTWEVLEEVSKDKLTEREKYYINFYDTKKYGYNQREG